MAITRIALTTVIGMSLGAATIASDANAQAAATGIYNSYMVLDQMRNVPRQPSVVAVIWSSRELYFGPNYAHPDNPEQERSWLGLPLQYDCVYCSPGIRIVREYAGYDGVHEYYNIEAQAFSENHARWMMFAWCCFPADNTGHVYDVTFTAFTVLPSIQLSVDGNVREPGLQHYEGDMYGPFTIDFTSGPIALWQDNFAWQWGRNVANTTTQGTISSDLIAIGGNPDGGVGTNTYYHAEGHPNTYLYGENINGEPSIGGFSIPDSVPGGYVTFEDLEIQ